MLLGGQGQEAVREHGDALDDVWGWVGASVHSGRVMQDKFSVLFH